jgi:hypothetical protein
MALGGHHDRMTNALAPIALIDATEVARRTVRGAGADGTAPERPRRSTRRRRS